MVSVIVPVYDVEKYLRECLDSIIRQTYKDLEIILVDDGSPDNCGAICDEYAAADSRITVIHKENGGPSAARNSGLDAVHGDYIYFVDGDDYISDDAVEALVTFAQKEKADIVSLFMDTFSEDPGISYDRKRICYPGASGAKNLIMRFRKENDWFPGAPLQFYRADFLKKEHLRFRCGMYYEDLLFNGLAYVRARKVSSVNKILYFYRLRSQSQTHSRITLKNLQSYQICMRGFEKEKKKYPKGSVQEKALDYLICFGANMFAEAYFSADIKDRKTFAACRRSVLKDLCAVKSVDARRPRLKLSHPQLWFAMRRMKGAVKALRGV